MILRIEHLGIAVNDMENANKLFSALLGVPNYKTETVESEKVSTSFFKVGESKVELLKATDPESSIAKFIAKKGEGIHHIAFAGR
jgi:methylmalonyl-CoA/ethylmalonyl-CoA epimerase